MKSPYNEDKKANAIATFNAYRMNAEKEILIII